MWFIKKQSIKKVMLLAVLDNASKCQDTCEINVSLTLLYSSLSCCSVVNVPDSR